MTWAPDDFFSVDTGSSTIGTSSLVLTVPRAVAAGKKLVLAHGRSDISGSVVVGLSSITDSKGNTWTVNDAISIRANQGGVTFSHCDLTTGLAVGDTITITGNPSTATSSRKFADVWVCSGLAPGGPSATSGATATANTNSNANGSSSTPAASLTTTAANSVVLFASYLGATGIPATAGSGYTRDSSRATTDGAPKGWTTEYGTVATAGSTTASITAAASTAWAAAAVAFAPGNVPIANAGPDQTNVEPYSTVQLDGTASTATNGTVVGYAWTQTAGTTVVLSDASAANPTYTAPGTSAGDTETFSLVVTDSGGATSSADSVSVTVLLAPERMMTSSGLVPTKFTLTVPDPPVGGGGTGTGTGTGGLALTVTPDAAFSPPRIRVDIADTRTPPSSSLTLYRRNPDGHAYAVRTSDGGPLPLASGAATIWDYEAPFDQPITYYTDDPAASPAATELFVQRPWLVHPGKPGLSFSPAALAPGTNATEDWDIVQGSFTVLMRSTPVITTGGARLAPASQLVIWTPDAASRDALKLLLADGSPLYLNVPPQLGWGIDSCYIAVAKVSAARVIQMLANGDRYITLPYQVVARPAGGTQAAYSWNDVAATYSSWQAMQDAAIPSWSPVAYPSS